MIAGLMLSLSYVFSRWMKFGSASIFWLGPQKSMMRFDGSFGSGMRCAFSLSMMQMASHTSLMVAGGLARPLISLMSAGLIVSSALIASLSAGIASARSPSTDSFSAFTLSASAWATAASAPTSACLA